MSVVVCSLAVLGAGTPVLLDATHDLGESQKLVERAELDKRAIALTHALADERDGMVEYVGAGRTSRDGAGVTEEQRARVDRQVSEIRETASPRVRRALDDLPRIRQQAQDGKNSAEDMYEAYTATIGVLQDVGAGVARSVPARAQTDGGSAHALPALGRAVEQASAVRGLLRGALAGKGAQPELTAQAQRMNVQEQAAIADFESAAGHSARDSFAKTVTGADVTVAERYLKRLTDQPYLSASDRAMSQERIDAALSARINSMRGVQASLATDEVRRLEKLRDDDVTRLELDIALVAGCLLVALGINVQTARSMARPLSVLTRGSRRLADDPAGEAPVEYRGRNDEFADVVHALNELRATVVTAREHAAEAEADNTYLVRSKDALTAERDRLRGEHAALKERLDALSGAVHGTFVNLGLRTLGLVERQLNVIEGLEDEENDPARLGTLFKLDHLATRMRRYSENLLLLAGAEHVTSNDSGPVALLDVLRAAIGEIERYERVDLGTLPPHVQVSGHAADDVSHVVAELLDNAATFSPPEAEVSLSGWLLETGEIMLSVEDEGIGATPRRLSALNARLSVPDGQEPPEMAEETDTYSKDRGPEEGLGMGLYVVARLASRHGLRVQLRERKQGGLAAVVAVPGALLPSRPAPLAATAGDGASAPAPAASFPGSVAEANSNALPVRRPRPVHRTAAAPETRSEGGTDGRDGTVASDAPDDPLVAAAEQTIRESGEDRAPEPAPLAGSVPEQHGPVDATARTDAAATDADTDTDAGTEEEEREAPRPKLTSMGLPKRTPQHVAAQPGAAPPRKRNANAEELRRRLGGFQRGAVHGRRDAEAEADAEENMNDQPGAQSDGGTAEEART